MSGFGLPGARGSRRRVYRHGKRLLARLLAPRWRGPREGLEPAVRRYLAGRHRGYLLRLVGDRAFALAAAASLLAAGATRALPPVNLSDVAAGNGGFAMNGTDAADHAGFSVSGAGDVNGDGLDDVVVGAPYADPGGNSSAGESYVVFGKADGTPVNLSAIVGGAGGFVINGIDPDDTSGISVSGAGDVNGDDLNDLIVGARYADPAGSDRAGESYVVFGKADGTPINLSAVAGGTGGFIINGIDPFDNSGISVSGAGDVDGDGLDDVIVGAHLADPGGNNTAGESYVVFGKADGTAVNLSDIAAGTGGFIINGTNGGDNSGFSVSGAGDVDGDNLDDVIVGAPGADLFGAVNGGRSYVVFGKADGAAVNLSAVATVTGGFVINGIDESDRSGRSVSDAGDVNGDGLGDVIVGAGYAGNFMTGESYVVFGKADGTPVNLSAVAAGTGGFVIYGIDQDDRAGWSVSGAGNVNGDGLHDVIVGAFRANTVAGESYVIFGKADGTVVNLSAVTAGTGGFVINGFAAHTQSGNSVSGAGDVNGDRLDDVVVGAPNAFPGGISDAGQGFVVFSPACPWDCDAVNDEIVSVTDLLALLAQYDPTSPVNCTGGSCDYTNDGCVDVVDLLKLLAHYDPAGLGCP